MSDSIHSSDDGEIPKRGRGRPSKINDEKIEQAKEAMLNGSTFKEAAEIIDVTPKWFTIWMQIGDEFPDGIYGKFRRAVLVAKQTYYSDLESSVKVHSKEDGALALEVLSRRNPRKWGKYRGEMGEIKKRLTNREKELDMLINEINELKKVAMADAVTT